MKVVTATEEERARRFALQLRSQMTEADRRERASADVERAAVLAKALDTASLDEADGILVAAVHAGVRPVEILLEIAAQALSPRSS